MVHVLGVFAERWDDPTPLDHRNPYRAPIRRAAYMPDILNHCRRAGPRSSLPVTSTGNLWEKDLPRSCLGEFIMVWRLP